MIKCGISAEIIDLRSLRPLDKNCIFRSVKKTKRLLVVDNGWKSYGISAEIVSLVIEKLGNLKEKPIRLGIKEMPIPSTRASKRMLLKFETILDLISKLTKTKIKSNIKNKFLKKLSLKETDIPYKDFQGPFKKMKNLSKFENVF